MLTERELSLMTKQFGVEPKIKGSLSGGSINQTQLGVINQKQVVIKVNRQMSDDFFVAEEYGLKKLRSFIESHEIELIVPKVLFRSSNVLIIEYINSTGQEDVKNLKKFAKALAKLHSIEPETSDVLPNNFIGATEQSNDYQISKSWSHIFWNKRLAFLLDKISQAFQDDDLVSLFLDIKDDVILFIDRMNPKMGPIHGDLWSGNYFFQPNGFGVLIDPAISYSHGLADIAMTRLFGSLPNEFYQEYYQSLSIAQDEDHLMLENIYNLYHLLNHYLIFGTSYRNQIINDIALIKKHLSRPSL